MKDEKLSIPSSQKPKKKKSNLKFTNKWHTIIAPFGSQIQEIRQPSPLSPDQETKSLFPYFITLLNPPSHFLQVSPKKKDDKTCDPNIKTEHIKSKILNKNEKWEPDRIERKTNFLTIRKKVPDL